MKLSSRRFKFLGITVFALLIFIPLIVFGGSGVVGQWYRIDSGELAIVNVSSLGRGNMCIQNSSGNSYFIPTKTDTEFSSFLTAVGTGRLGITLLSSCCNDGICSGTDNCSNCSADCGGCTCSSFTYSNWSGCCNGTQTRSITSKSPANCTGGSPVVSQSCSSSVPGCISGTCRNGSVYLDSGYCYGSPISQTNICISASTPNSSCIYGGPSNSTYYVPSGGCSYSVACSATPGCPTGYSCRSGSVYLSNSSCGGGVSNSISSVCITNSDPNNTCLSYNSLTSIIYTPGSGCTY